MLSPKNVHEVRDAIGLMAKLHPSEHDIEVPLRYLRVYGGDFEKEFLSEEAFVTLRQRPLLKGNTLNASKYLKELERIQSLSSLTANRIPFVLFPSCRSVPLSGKVVSDVSDLNSVLRFLLGDRITDTYLLVRQLLDLGCYLVGDAVQYLCGGYTNDLLELMIPVTLYKTVTPIIHEFIRSGMHGGHGISATTMHLQIKDRNLRTEVDIILDASYSPYEWLYMYPCLNSRVGYGKGPDGTYGTIEHDGAKSAIRSNIMVMLNVTEGERYRYLFQRHLWCLQPGTVTFSHRILDCGVITSAISIGSDMAVTSLMTPDFWPYREPMNIHDSKQLIVFMESTRYSPDAVTSRLAARWEGLTSSNTGVIYTERSREARLITLENHMKQLAYECNDQSLVPAIVSQTDGKWFRKIVTNNVDHAIYLTQQPHVPEGYGTVRVVHLEVPKSVLVNPTIVLGIPYCLYSPTLGAHTARYGYSIYTDRVPMYTDAKVVVHTINCRNAVNAYMDLAITMGN